jgi:hypothetical protein
MSESKGRPTPKRPPARRTSTSMSMQETSKPGVVRRPKDLTGVPDVLDPERVIEIAATAIRMVPHMETWLENVSIGELAEIFGCRASEKAVRTCINMQADAGWMKLMLENRYPGILELAGDRFPEMEEMTITAENPDEAPEHKVLEPEAPVTAFQPESDGGML